MTDEQRQAFNKRTGMNREERRRAIKKWKADKTLEICPVCGYRTPRKKTDDGRIYCTLCKAILKDEPVDPIGPAEPEQPEATAPEEQAP